MSQYIAKNGSAAEEQTSFTGSTTESSSILTAMLLKAANKKIQCKNYLCKVQCCLS